MTEFFLFESSPFSPSIHNTDIVLWLDAADTSTIEESGGAVSQWNDKSGNGNNATQSSAPLKPTTNATTRNGYNVIDFDGSNSMTLPSALYTIPNGPNTVFAVSVTTLDTTAQRIINMAETNSTRFSIQYVNVSQRCFFISDDTAGQVITLDNIVKTNWNIFQGGREGTLMEFSANGAPELSNALANDESGIDSAVIGSFEGSTDFLNGSIAEIIVYDRYLSDAEKGAVERYLANKWDIGIVAPSNISSLQLWLDAADTSTITSASGAVSQWNDKSGNDYHVTQTTAAKKPTTGASLHNGNNILTFDGGDTLEIPSGIFSIPNGDNTIFVVAKRNTETGSGELVVNMDSSGTNNYYLGYGNTAGDVIFLNKDVDANTLVSSGNTNTDYNIMTAFRSATTLSLSINGATATTNSFGADAPSVDGANIGSRQDSSSFVIGSIAEILIYGKALSEDEIASVEGYLSVKWGITT